ncbi:MAG TPA: NAD(P)H-hydrate epimerase, partial [Burkholderiales bacterium]|nr:NAD(P)H-hydrate epimerase [Burkholderiales bacterium]
MRNLAKLFEPVYSSREIREIERLAPFPLMERAGLAVAELAMELAIGGRMLVLAGPGNNGGDAFVAARHLKSWGMDVTLLFLGKEEKLPEDAALAYRAWIDSGGVCHESIPENGKWGLAIDGLFGTGLSRPISGNCGEIVRMIDSLGIPVLSIDMPSGICTDTGSVLGIAVKALHTLSFIAMKPGLLTSEGLDHCGEIHFDALGLSLLLLKSPKGWLSNQNILQASFKKRSRNSHKGLFGSTAVIGGGKGMEGAALLAARAALKLGSGKVFLGMPVDFQVDSLQPEIMVRSPEKLLDAAAVVMGPGLGKSDWASTILAAALESESHLVIDADALNLISMNTEARRMIRSRRGSSILTPHPAEAARLLECTTEQVQQDRIRS